MTATEYLIQSNQTQFEWGTADNTLVHKIERQAAQTPEAIALSFEGRSLSYKDLLLAVLSLAFELQAQGCEPGDFVALWMDRSFEMVIAMLAIMRMGAAYVPLDLEAPKDRLQGMLDDCCPRLMLTESNARDLSAFSVAHKRVVNLDALLQASRADLKLNVPLPEPLALCYAIYTSGSTGTPKAAMNNHAGVFNRLMWERAALGISERDVALQKTPYTFDVSVWELFAPLMFGARLVIAKPGGHLDPLYLTDLIEREQITMVHFVPSMLRIYLDSVLHPPQCVTSVKFSGEALSAELLQRVLAAWPSRPAINLYGPTECSVEVTTWDCREFAQTGKVLIGKPMPNVRVYVLDEGRQPVPPGQMGELYIAGLNVGNGYLNRPELTAERFLPDAFASLFGDTRAHASMYRTGDLVISHPEQGIEYFGRTDFQVKVNGVRIELGEIEEIAMQSGLLDDVIVAAQPMGVQDQRLIGLAKPSRADSDWESQLITHLQGKLPKAMVPLNWFQVSQLPLTSSGKTDRNAALAEVECRNGGRLWPCLAALMEQQVMAHPQAHAIEVQGRAPCTYGELDTLSATLAAQLQRLGVRMGDHVALLMGRSFETIVSMLAVTRLGAIYAPIDTQAPAARQQQMLETLSPRLVLTADALPALLNNPPPLERPWVQAPGHTAACVLFTSGSTGRPKGVIVPHEGIARLVMDSRQPKLHAGVRWAWLSSPAFDATHLEVWGPLLNGGTVVLPEAKQPSLDDLVLFLSSHRLDGAWLTAALFNVLVDHAPTSLQSLQEVAVGGERLSQAHVERCMQACPTTRIINGYGPTEACTFATTHAVRAEDLNNPGGIPLGKAIRATAMRLGASEASAHADTGELIIGGPGVSLGYIGATAAQQAAFVTEGSQRWYKTGDLVRRRPDGLYEYLGRIDQQVKIQGNRIELEDVEHALMSLPGVRQAVAVVLGQSAAERRIAAVLVLASGHPADTASWTTQLEGLLQPVAVPRQLDVVTQIPLTLNGKADRAAIVKSLELNSRAAQQMRVANQVWASALQAELARLWQEVLPRPPESPAAHFQQCGGTSLAAMKLSALIRQRLGRNVPPGELVLHPTLEAQSQMLALLPMDSSAVPAPQMEVPLSEQQQDLVLGLDLDLDLGLFNHAQNPPRPSKWLVNVPIVLQGNVPWDTLVAAFKALSQRHMMLRVVAQVKAGGMSTKLLPHTPDEAFEERGTLAQLPDHLAFPPEVLDHIERPLNPDPLGPMRVISWHLPQGQRLLIWSVQHHVIDEASIDLALQELDALLNQRPLPPIKGDPLAIVLAEQEGLDQDPLRLTAASLGQALNEVAPPWAPTGDLLGMHLPIDLPQDTLQRLASACERWGCTPFAPLLTAFASAVQSVAGEPWRHVLTPFTRRIDERLIDTLNYCLDVRHIEAGRRPQETLSQQLTRVLDQALHATTEGFQPLPRIQELIAQQHPGALPWLAQFALTWRTGTRRSLNLGPGTARLLAWPQRPSRFGLSLHIEDNDGPWAFSIEAEAGAFASGFVERLRTALIQSLDELSEIDTLPARHTAMRVPHAPQAPDTARDAHLKQIWSQFAPGTTWADGPQTHFLKNGGTSLAIIRMGVKIRQELGLALHVPAFMACPTFEQLSQLCSPVDPLPAAAKEQHLQWVGSRQAAQVIFLIPGHKGHAVSLVPMAMELLKQLGPDCAVAITDLESIVTELPERSPILAPIEQTLRQQIQQIGVARITAIAGFSIGGQLSLQIHHQLADASHIKVCLLDTYDLRATQESRSRRIVRSLMRLWYRLAPLDRAHEIDPSNTLNLDDQDAEVKTSGKTTERWRLLMSELLQASPRAPHADVCLIRARYTLNYTGLLRRRGSNGFDVTKYCSFDLIDLPAHHMQLPRSHAPATAKSLASWVLRPASGSPKLPKEAGGYT